MKKLIATFCLAVGMVSTSFAANSSAPSSPNVSYAQEKTKTSTPDKIILVVDERGVIVDIIVIKKR